MNDQPIEQSTDPDLKGSAKAMQRAALKAREIAISTGTMIVVEIDDQVVHLKPGDPADPLPPPSTAA